MLAIGCFAPFVTLAIGAVAGSYAGGVHGGYWGAGLGAGFGIILTVGGFALLDRLRRPGGEPRRQDRSGP